MVNNFRYELNFKNIPQLENKLSFCNFHGINNINIPCKGIIKKNLLNSTIEYIKKYHNKFNVVYHYSLYHQYNKNKDISYQDFLDFIKICNLNHKSQVLLVSGSNKKKDFDVINVLSELKNENYKYKLGIAYNPYLNKYYNNRFERYRYDKKISSGLVNSAWLQFGTDIKLLENEINFLMEYKYQKKINLFGSLLIPSKQFLARFKFRPWKGVYISENYINSLENFYSFTKDLVALYLENNITPVIETDFSSIQKLEFIYKLLNS